MSNVIKVGLFATIGLIVLAVLIWQIEDINPFGPEGSQLSARFATVAGLDDKAPVRVAGVRVGRVDGISLEARPGCAWCSTSRWTCRRGRWRASRASGSSATSTSS